MLRFYHVSLITRCRIKVQQTVYCRHGVICLQREPASHSLNILFVRSYAILYMYVNIRVFLSSLDVARSIAIIDNCVASSHHPCNSSIDELVCLLHRSRSFLISSICAYRTTRRGYVRCKILSNTCVDLSREIDKKWISVNLVPLKFEHCRTC